MGRLRANFSLTHRVSLLEIRRDPEADTFLADITKARAGGNYILALRNRRTEISDDPGARDPDAKGGYDIDSVHFRYPLRPDISVLKGVDLKVSLLHKYYSRLMFKL